MVEYVLAVTFSWMSPLGHLEQRPYEERFDTYEECREDFRKKQVQMLHVAGEGVISTGDVCVPHKLTAKEIRLRKMAEAAAAAAATAASGAPAPTKK